MVEPLYQMQCVVLGSHITSAQIHVMENFSSTDSQNESNYNLIGNGYQYSFSLTTNQFIFKLLFKFISRPSKELAFLAYHIVVFQNTRDCTSSSIAYICNIIDIAAPSYFNQVSRLDHLRSVSRCIYWS